MEKILLVNSKKNENNNFNNTIIDGKKVSDLKMFLNNYDYNMLKGRFGEHKKVKIWGITSLTKSDKNFTKNINIMSRIARGDFALFFYEDIFHHYGVVVHKLKEKNPELSMYLWGNNKFDLIFFLDDIKSFDVSRKVLYEAANLNLDYKRFSIKELDDNESNIIFKNFFNNNFNNINNGNKNNINVSENLSMNILEKVEIEKILEEPVRDSTEEVTETSLEEPKIESTIVEDSLASKISKLILIGEEDGSLAQSDGITKNDKLNRSKVVKSFRSLYVDYAKNNVSPFFSGVFADWGKGKSSFIEMIKDEIESEPVVDVTHVVSKIDCSLIDQKEYLWLNILEQIINDTELKKEKGRFLKGFLMRWRYKRFNIIKIEFNARNLLNLLKANKFILFLYTLLFLLGIYLVESSKNEEFTQFKNIAGWIALSITVFKGISNINNYIQGIFLSSMKKNKKLVYFKSQHEYKQLISILNKSLKSDMRLRILVILDEVDRMNKELFSDLIEITQLFKSIQIQDENKETNVTIDFLFSFNHKIVFPIIGKSVMLEDEHLLKDSVLDEMKNDEGEVNKFKLGKEYMDKYLDLTIYLEDKPDLKKLIYSIFDPNFVDEESVASKDEFIKTDNLENIKLTNEKKSSNSQKNNTSEDENANQDENANDEQFKIPVFSNLELEIINSIASKLNSDPRKLIRLKNSLLLLRMLNRNESYFKIDEKKYLEELSAFVSSYLSNNNVESKNDSEIKYLKNSSYVLGSSK